MSFERGDQQVSDQQVLSKMFLTVMCAWRMPGFPYFGFHCVHGIDRLMIVGQWIGQQVSDQQAMHVLLFLF